MTPKDSVRELNKNKSPIVLVLVGVWIVGIGYKLFGFLNYEYYQFMFQQLSEQLIILRYCFSIGFRFVALIIAAGLVAHIEFYRKAAIYLASFNLIMLYWKHPFYVFHNIAVYSERDFIGEFPVVTGNEVLAYPMFPWISLVTHSVIDVVFCGCLLYVLTRPNIKAKFVK